MPSDIKRVQTAFPAAYFQGYARAWPRPLNVSRLAEGGGDLALKPGSLLKGLVMAERARKMARGRMRIDCGTRPWREIEEAANVSVTAQGPERRANVFS